MFKWIGSMFVFLATLLFVLWGCTDSGVEQGDLEFPDSSLDRYAVSWSQVDYTVRASGFFGDTTWDHWPDNVVEIGYPARDSLLLAMSISIPLIDTIQGAWYRNYLAPSNFKRSFRIVVADNDVMDVDSVVVQVTTESERGELYGDIPAVNLVFFQVARQDGKIYFQNQVDMGEARGKTVLFSQTAENAGDYDEAYVLVLKEKTDQLHFRHVLMPEPIINPTDTCVKVEYCYMEMVPFSDYVCREDSVKKDTALVADSSVVDSIVVDSSSVEDSSLVDTVVSEYPEIPALVEVSRCYFIDGYNYVNRCDSVCKYLVTKEIADKR